MPFEESTFSSRLAQVRRRIEDAALRSGRDAADIKLVAVSKKFSAERMREAYDAGAREFGENYVQEFAEKRPELNSCREARFHFIGHLQSNKVNLACELFDVIQTVDSVKLVQRIEHAAGKRRAPIDIMIEVKLSEEENKTGASPEEIPTLVDAARKSLNVRTLGLMTMPPWSEDSETSRPYFRQLATLARQNGLTELSMGMSNDFEVGIEEGATIVRIGTALFGRRPKPQQRT